MSEDNKDDATTIMKIVEAIAITPDDARVVVESYKAQAKKAYSGKDERYILNKVLDKIVWLLRLLQVPPWVALGSRRVA